LTLRLRLTFWYSAVLAVIITLFGCVVYGLTVWMLYKQIDTTLGKTADSIIHGSRLYTELNKLQIPQIDRFGAPGVYVQIWETDGSLFSSSQNLHYTEALDPGGLTGTTRLARDVYVSSAHLRVVTTPILTEDKQLLGYIQ
jgi:hypothetical protein